MSAELACDRALPPTSTRRWPLFLACVLFLGHAWFLSRAQGFGAVDDAWIAFRYVQQLLLGHGLVFNPGEWVEGYSSLLWVLLLAGLNAAGLELLSASLLAGTLCGLLVLLLIARLASRVLGCAEVGPWVALFLALDGGFVRWAVDGLETQLFALLLLLAAQRLWPGSGSSTSARAPLLLGQVLAAGTWLGLAALTRPEGLGFIGLFALWCGVRAGAFLGPDHASAGSVHATVDSALPLSQCLSGSRLKRPCSAGASALWLSLSAGIWVLAQLLWRRVTYGEWVANTALLKVDPGFVSTVRGVRYCLMFALERWPFLAGCLLLGWMQRRAPTRGAPTSLAFPMLLVAGMTASTVLVGGDWMGWSRFFVPVLAFLYLAALGWVWRDEAKATLAGFPLRPLLLGAMAFGLFLTSSWFGELPRLRQAGIEHVERARIADHLRQHARRTDRILTEELGEIPFQTGLFALDVYGLIDPYIARFGEWDPDSPPGHQKTELNYSLSRHPDWLIMANFHAVWARHAQAEPGVALRFPALRRYVPVPLALPEGRLELYRLASPGVRPE